MVLNNVVVLSLMSLFMVSLNPTPKDAIVNITDYDCIVSALYHESRGESVSGVRAVLSVIYNRVQSRNFPNTYCGVVFQPKQFSYLNNRDTIRIMYPNPINRKDVKALQHASLLAQEAVQGTFKPNLPKEVLWYTKHGVKKPWMKNMVIVSKIDSHKFMKEI